MRTFDELYEKYAVIGHAIVFAVVALYPGVYAVLGSDSVDEALFGGDPTAKFAFTFFVLMYSMLRMYELLAYSPADKLYRKTRGPHDTEGLSEALHSDLVGVMCRARATGASSGEVAIGILGYSMAYLTHEISEAQVHALVARTYEIKRGRRREETAERSSDERIVN